MPASAPDDFHHVLQESVADVDLLDGFHGAYELLAGTHRLVVKNVELRACDRAPILAADAEFHVALEHLPLLGRRGIMEPMAQHEAIKLGLRQLEGPALLDRVLRGNNKKRGR